MWCPVTYLIQFFSQLQHFFHFFSSAVISHIYHSHSNPPPLPIFTFSPVLFPHKGNVLSEQRRRRGAWQSEIWSLRPKESDEGRHAHFHPIAPLIPQEHASIWKQCEVSIPYCCIFPFIRFGRDTKLCDCGSASALRLQHPTFPPSSPSPLRI